MNKIRVILVSPQSLFRQGIEHSLSEMRDIVISEATEVNDQLLSEIDNLPPDVALVDIDGPSDNGLTLARRIKQRSPSIAVVVLTSNPSDAQLFQAALEVIVPEVGAGRALGGGPFYVQTGGAEVT